MPSPERGGPGGPDQRPQSAREAPPYQRAARFSGERPAGEAYFAVQRVIYDAPQPVDVSSFRLRLNNLWHVAALGVMPPATVLHAIESILSAGEPAELPAEVWQALHRRRAQATRLGPWIEAHHRPGRRLE